jgi:glycine reductase
VDRSKYYRALKELGARAAVYLGDAAARAQNAASQVFEMSPPLYDRSGLPRVAYIYMLASQQLPTELDEPVLYGDNIRHLLPTVLHPNEILDGAVIAPYWNFGAETFMVQNHPMVLELYRRHHCDLSFAGVVATIAAETDAARSRTAVMAANLARYTLGADAVVLTKYGGGIPESAVMETFEACEDAGMKGAIAIWAHGGDGHVEGTLTFMSPRADAVVSCGIHEDSVDLGPMARVIGRDMVGPLIIEPEENIRPSRGPLTLKHQHIAGAINQLGGGFLSSEEY